MREKKRIAKIIIVIITFSVLTLIKGFTANIKYNNDPTSTFVKSSNFLIINHYKIDSENTGISKEKLYEEKGFEIIHSDEFSYVRDTGYTLIIFAWWIELVLLLRYGYKAYRKKRVI